jgi:hypothetical protein
MARKIFCVVMFSVMSAALSYAAPADVPKSGQTTCYDANGGVISCATTTMQGEDGALQRGFPWPTPRFTVISSGTGTVVGDNLTGLMWAGDPTLSTLCSSGTTTTWQGSLDYVACLNTNNYLNHNDWRLPNVNELESLVHAGYNEVICTAPSTYCATNTAWLNTQGFSNVQAYDYWSSTTYAGNTSSAWLVNMVGGYVSRDGGKSNSVYVWPVRGGQ